ncbi:MAG: asparagine synthase (glutamine-hydrolyzing) [Planctomycetes bacterium]|nr:asparagine synthase (glutamine-hydrolyzing) [Planctomycetota bacterium]
MCGIAGIARLEDGAPPVRQDDLERMAAALAHRGPDAAGFHLCGPVGFAFRRLSIIDRQGGDQPIYNENGRACVVFNGEIYNFVELRGVLQDKGHRFRTRSDTEVILHGYEEWGARGVAERLRGMFAFAIHDQDAGRVVLARDRLGKKPLHVASAGGALCFASELKALLALAALPRRVAPRALLDYAALGYVPAPATIFAGVEKLQPGHVLVLDRGGARREKYWEAPFAVEPIGMDQAAARLLELMRDAVRCRLVAEVPLGCFLSGGLDSSAVVAAMVDQLGTAVNAVTVGFQDAACDERGAARAVARCLGITPVEEEVLAAPAVLDGVAATFDEPHADPSNVPTYLLCQATRRRVTVALSGDGGDELFGGYRRYAFDQFENRVRALVPAALRRVLFGPLGALLPKADWLPRPLRAKTLIQNLARDPVEAYFRSVARVAPEEAARLVDPDLLAAAGGYAPLERFREIDARRALADPLLRVRALDLETWLPDDILAKVDRASMAHSLEVRVPLLDHRLVEFASCLPPRLLLKGGAGKLVFKRALRGILPDATIDRRKHGFDLPAAHWLETALAAELDELVASGSALEGYFDRRRAAELLAEQRARRRDRTAELWLLLCFGRWRRRWMPS